MFKHIQTFTTNLDFISRIINFSNVHSYIQWGSVDIDSAIRFIVKDVYIVLGQNPPGYTGGYIIIIPTNECCTWAVLINASQHVGTDKNINGTDKI